jgi:hypothetical protein
MTFPYGWAAPALLAATVGAGGPAISAPPVYLVTATVETADGRMVSEEFLSLAARSGTTLATLRDQAGESASVPVVVKPNGMLEVRTSNPAITCYNVAMNVLSDGATAHSATSSLPIAVSPYVVRVPLRLTTAEFAGGTHGIIAEGSATFTVADQTATRVMLIVEGGVTSRHRTLVAARFRETTVLASNGAVIAQSTCSVSRASAPIVSPAPALET